jgi:hypothetical protein
LPSRQSKWWLARGEHSMANLALGNPPRLTRITLGRAAMRQLTSSRERSRVGGPAAFETRTR